MKTFITYLLLLSFQLNGNAQTIVAKRRTKTSYNITDCHYCTDLKDSLTKKQMAFVFFDIDRDTEENQMLTN
jgi:glutaredoxin